MKHIKTFMHVTLPYQWSQVLVFLRVYFYTAMFLVFLLGSMFIWQTVSGYHIEVRQNVVTPIGGGL